VKTGPINSYSLKWAVALHGLLLAAAAIVPLVPGCRTKEIAIPLDFTIVLDANQIDPNVPEETAEPAPKPAPLPEPSKPTPLPDPPKDAVIVEKKKEPEKKVEKKPDPPKPPPKKPEPPPKKPEFQKGKRVEAQKKPQPPRFDEIYKPYDPSKPTSAKPVTDKQLSRDEIEKALRDGARAGTRNSIPEDEVSRCVLLVRRALHDAWVQPSAGDAGPQPAFLDIRLDSTGRIVSYRISQSSGSAYFDQTVLKAAANAQPIRGLTLAFLKQYETVTVEFRLE
jgi:colicin import membrane protein